MKSKIKLSKHDKALVSLWWLLEIVSAGISGYNYDDVPDHKLPMYKSLCEKGELIHGVAREVNDAFNSEIDKVFSNDYQGQLADACIAVVTLFEDFDPAKIKKIMTAAGITNKMIHEKLSSEDKE